MLPFQSPEDYLFNLHTTKSGEAKRIWKQKIKDYWDNKCAYCESEEELTIDHVIPQCKGGTDFTDNVVCCCKKCNHDKGHLFWEDWYSNQSFFTEEKKNAILNWMNNKKKQTLYTYSKRTNKVL